MWNSMRIESKQNHLQQILELTNLHLNLKHSFFLIYLTVGFFELFLQVLGGSSTMKMQIKLKSPCI